MMTSFCTLPKEKTFRLRNATVPACLVDGLSPAITADPDGLISVDIAVMDGRIDGILPAGSGDGSETSVNLDASMVWPCFVDVHTHIDKGHIWPAPAQPQRHARRRAVIHRGRPGRELEPPKMSARA